MLDFSLCYNNRQASHWNQCYLGNWQPIGKKWLSGYLGFRWKGDILAVRRIFYFVCSDPYEVWDVTKSYKPFYSLPKLLHRSYNCFMISLEWLVSKGTFTLPLAIAQSVSIQFVFIFVSFIQYIFKTLYRDWVMW